MNGIEKLKQLTNVYRAALKEGIASEGWVQRLREKMKDYGRELWVKASDIIETPSFLEWVASTRTKLVDVGELGSVEEGEILLALHEKHKNDQQITETLLEVVALDYAVNKTTHEEIGKVEVAYQQLFDVVQRVNDLDRYAQFRALNDLIRALEVWLDGCKMIDIEIW